MFFPRDIYEKNLISQLPKIFLLLVSNGCLELAQYSGHMPCLSQPPLCIRGNTL